MLPSADRRRREAAPFGKRRTLRHRWMILVPVLGLAVAGTAALAPAEADCIDNCSIYSPNVFSDWYSRKESCMLECTNKRPRTSYGALAYGAGSMAWGFSYGQDSAAAADRVALDKCKPNGDD